MKVGELKKALSNVPDDANIAVWLVEKSAPHKYTGRYQIESVDLDALGDPENEGYTVDLNVPFQGN